LTHDTNFSYSVFEMNGADPDFFNIANSTTVTELLPAARRYASRGGVDGRWMQLSSPSPLYQLEVTAHLVVWSYENQAFERREIGLPAGGLFDVKLAFVNRDEIFTGQDHYHR